MVDHSRIPTDRDFVNMLDEMEEMLTFLRANHSAARARAKLPVKDGYPARSMPESDIAGGRTGDPTADYVVGLAGGKVDKDDMAEGDDTWREPYDPLGNLIRNMNRETEDARNRLRGAAGALRQAAPRSTPDPIGEQCKSCGMSKAAATDRGRNPKRWVVSEGMDKTCSDRIKANRSPGPGSGHFRTTALR